MTLTFLATGEPTPDAELGTARITDTGLMKAGRRQVYSAKNYLGKPKWIITSHEPDARETARHMLDDDFAFAAHFLPSLAVRSSRYREAPTDLWKKLNEAPFSRYRNEGIVVVRPCMIPYLVVTLTQNYPNAREIRGFVEGRHFSYGEAIRVSGGTEPRIELY